MGIMNLIQWIKKTLRSFVMVKSREFSIFISHAKDDVKLAKLIKDFFIKSLKIDDDKIFNSDDTESIGMDELPYNSITEALRSSKVVIGIITPNSRYRPWVLFEIGGAHFFGNKKNPKSLILVYANGINIDSLPPPLQQRNVRDISKPDVIKKLCETVASKLDRSDKMDIDLQLLDDIKIEATKGVRGWEFVQQSLVGERILRSPFGIENLLKEMKNTIFIAGQDLNHLTKKDNREKYMNLIFEKISRENKTIQIMICNPEYDYAVQTWQFVTGEGYKEDLENSLNVFTEWNNKANSQRLNGILDIRMIDMVPLTITFVDPEEGSGRLVFNPVVFYNPESDPRPCYKISRDENPYVFDYYWFAYKHAYENVAKKIS
jgi:hypothetical protein